MHERSPKAKPLDTILYEIDMFRHCSRTVPEKRERAEKSKSDADRSEYNLGIEGFLLHLRNLLAFLTSQRTESTDLGINAPKDWSERRVEQRQYSDLMKKARDINNKYGAAESSCYDQISKFLQHCTTYRHAQGRNWDIEGISKDIEPVLAEFEHRFVGSVPEVRKYSGGIGEGTSTMRRFITLLDRKTE